jgi:hypothetical protein
MEHSKFLEWLSTVAEWQQTELRTGDKRGPKSDKQIFNETWPVELTALKTRVTCCEHCGKCVENQQFFYKYKKDQVLTQCSACGLFKHPKTGEFSVKPTQLAAIMRHQSD